jgi:hypothetical protein
MRSMLHGMHQMFVQENWWNSISASCKVEMRIRINIKFALQLSVYIIFNQRLLSTFGKKIYGEADFPIMLSFHAYV